MSLKSTEKHIPGSLDEALAARTPNVEDIKAALSKVDYTDLYNPNESALDFQKKVGDLLNAEIQSIIKLFEKDDKETARAKMKSVIDENFSPSEIRDLLLKTDNDGDLSGIITLATYNAKRCEFLQLIRDRDLLKQIAEVADMDPVNLKRNIVTLARDFAINEAKAHVSTMIGNIDSLKDFNSQAFQNKVSRFHDHNPASPSRKLNVSFELHLSSKLAIESFASIAKDINREEEIAHGIVGIHRLVDPSFHFDSDVVLTTLRAKDPSIKSIKSDTPMDLIAVQKFNEGLLSIYDDTSLKAPLNWETSFLTGLTIMLGNEEIYLNINNIYGQDITSIALDNGDNSSPDLILFAGTMTLLRVALKGVNTLGKNDFWSEFKSMPEFRVMELFELPSSGKEIAAIANMGRLISPHYRDVPVVNAITLTHNILTDKAAEAGLKEAGVDFDDFPNESPSQKSTPNLLLPRPPKYRRINAERLRELTDKKRGDYQPDTYAMYGVNDLGIEFGKKRILTDFAAGLVPMGWLIAKSSEFFGQNNSLKDGADDPVGKTNPIPIFDLLTMGGKINETLKDGKIISNFIQRIGADYLMEVTKFVGAGLGVKSGDWWLAIQSSKIIQETLYRHALRRVALNLHPETSDKREESKEKNPDEPWKDLIGSAWEKAAKKISILGKMTLNEDCKDFGYNNGNLLSEAMKRLSELRIRFIDEVSQSKSLSLVFPNNSESLENLRTSIKDAIKILSPLNHNSRPTVLGSIVHSMTFLEELYRKNYVVKVNGDKVFHSKESIDLRKDLRTVIADFINEGISVYYYLYEGRMYFRAGNDISPEKEYKKLINADQVALLNLDNAMISGDFLLNIVVNSGNEKISENAFSLIAKSNSLEGMRDSWNHTWLDRISNSYHRAENPNTAGLAMLKILFSHAALASLNYGNANQFINPFEFVQQVIASESFGVMNIKNFFEDWDREDLLSDSVSEIEGNITEARIKLDFYNSLFGTKFETYKEVLIQIRQLKTNLFNDGYLKETGHFSLLYNNEYYFDKGYEKLVLEYSKFDNSKTKNELITQFILEDNSFAEHRRQIEGEISKIVGSGSEFAADRYKSALLSYFSKSDTPGTEIKEFLTSLYERNILTKEEVDQYLLEISKNRIDGVSSMIEKLEEKEYFSKVSKTLYENLVNDENVNLKIVLENFVRGKKPTEILNMIINGSFVRNVISDWMLSSINSYIANLDSELPVFLKLIRNIYISYTNDNISIISNLNKQQVYDTFLANIYEHCKLIAKQGYAGFDAIALMSIFVKSEFIVPKLPYAWRIGLDLYSKRSAAQRSGALETLMNSKLKAVTNLDLPADLSPISMLNDPIVLFLIGKFDSMRNLTNDRRIDRALPKFLELAVLAGLMLNLPNKSTLAEYEQGYDALYLLRSMWKQMGFKSFRQDILYPLKTGFLQDTLRTSKEVKEGLSKIAANVKKAEWAKNLEWGFKNLIVDNIFPQSIRELIPAEFIFDTNESIRLQPYLALTGSAVNAVLIFSGILQAPAFMNPVLFGALSFVTSVSAFVGVGNSLKNFARDKSFEETQAPKIGLAVRIPLSIAVISGLVSTLPALFPGGVGAVLTAGTLILGNRILNDVIINKFVHSGLEYLYDRGFLRIPWNKWMYILSNIPGIKKFPLLERINQTMVIASEFRFQKDNNDVLQVTPQKRALQALNKSKVIEGLALLLNTKHLEEIMGEEISEADLGSWRAILRKKEEIKRMLKIMIGVSFESGPENVGEAKDQMDNPQKK